MPRDNSNVETKETGGRTMRRRGMVVAVVVALAVLAIPAVVSSQQKGQAGNSNIAQVDLRGPWGRMHYNLSGCTLDFVFNGHELTPGTTYELKVKLAQDTYEDLASGTPGEDGNLHLAGSPTVPSFKNKFVFLYYRNDAGKLLTAIRSGTKYSFTCTCCE